MTRKRILIIGNHTCGNRGDAAILRGLLHEIERRIPDADIEITSRYPVSSSYLLGRKLKPDLFHGREIIRGSWARKRRRRLLPKLLRLASAPSMRRCRFLLPKAINDIVDEIAEYDLVIQVGGSNFVDLYGLDHFKAAFATFIADVPLVLLGQSMGPIERPSYSGYISQLLNHSTYVGLRESASRQLLEAGAMPMHAVHSGADTAWSVDTTNLPRNDIASRFVGEEPRPIVAITTRSLAPFDKRLKTTQKDYEQAFAALIDSMVEKGFNVLAVSTCTGIDSYHNDDRMVALRIGEHVRDGHHYHIVMDELNDIEIGAMLSQCEFLVATRLHSAIIAMNVGTPAMALHYEHKSKGTFEDMGLEYLSAEVSDLLDGSLIERVDSLLARRRDLRAEIMKPVQAARARSRAMVNEGLEAAGF